MEKYRHMYAILCGAIDECIDDLKRIPLAVPYADKLERALLDAEEFYLNAEEDTPTGPPLFSENA